MDKNTHRGKRKDNGEWVYGYYVRLNGDKHFIYTGYAETDCGSYYPDYYEVIPETIGQCTGEPDKNGKPIFEGDILAGAWGAKIVVYFDRDYLQFRVQGEKPAYASGREIDYFGEVVVIGNIHDSPELLAGG